MLDHLEIQTPTLEATLAFYRQTLAPLGYKQKVDGRAKGFGDDNGLDFFVVEGEASSNTHFAFTAPSREIVDQIYESARNDGLTLDLAPALAPHIHPNYYAGYLRDPDGRLIEFVCHKAEA